MKFQTLAPEDRAYLREVVASAAGRKWMTALMQMRPAIAGKTSEERAFSASEAMGYERAVGNMAALLDDPLPQPEVKHVDIRSD
jgi:hypothetical protein